MVVVALGLGLYADFGRLGDELASFRWELFPLALALTALNYLLRFWRWQRYLARLEIEVPTGRSFAIFLAGLSGTITPAKLGEVLKCGLLKRSFGVPVRRSVPIVLAERVTDATGVVVLALAAGAGTNRWPLLALALAGVAAIVLVVRSPLLERFSRPRRGSGSRARSPGDAPAPGDDCALRGLVVLRMPRRLRLRAGLAPRPLARGHGGRLLAREPGRCRSRFSPAASASPKAA